VAVTLPVLLTDGAGPHLVDEAGTLVLALGPHPAVPEAKVAMGPAAGGVVVGLVRPVGGPVWAWLVRAEVAEAERTRALDVLDALPGEEALAAWPHDPLGPAGWRSLTGDADGGDR
jgi:hypothetical protein